MYQENGNPFDVPFRRDLVVLMMTLASVCLIQWLLPSVNGLLIQWLGLTPDFLGKGTLWTPFTSLLLHENLMSGIWTLLTLVLFGKAIAGVWNTFEFTSYFVLTSVLGNLGVVVLCWCVDAGGYLLGPAGGLLATLTAAILVFGDHELNVLFMRIKVKWLASIVLAVVALLSVVSGQLVSLGYFIGAAGGWGYVKMSWYRQARALAQAATHTPQSRTVNLEFFDESR